ARNFSLDIENDKIYWTDPGNNKIQRANLDGSDSETLAADLRNLKGIALGIPLEVLAPSPPLPKNATKMYWTQGSKILRGNPYSTNVETLVTGRNPSSLTLDVAGNKMYWIDHAYNSIFKATLDGKQQEKLITGLSNTPGMIALDVANNKIYWTDPGTGKISRANLDGSGVLDLVEGQGSLYGLALDVEAGKMYWSRSDYIFRANLDGSDSERILEWSYQIYDIVLDVIAGKMYAIHSSHIIRANLNGSDTETLVNVASARNFSLDIENDKIYWTDPSNNKIRRADLDGTSAHNLSTGLDDLRDIALDPSAPPPTDPVVDVPLSTEPTVSVTPPTEPVISDTPLIDAMDLHLTEHTGDVRCVAYSPWGVVLASGGTDNMMRLWRTSTGQPLSTYEHGGDVNSIAFTPNDTYIATGSDDGKLRVYKWSDTADTWVFSQSFSVPGGALTNNVKSVAFSHDNTMLACGTSGNIILIYDYNPDNEKWIYRTNFEGHKGAVNSLAFSPHGVVLASASDDDTVRLWRARNGQALSTLSDHTADVNSVAFSRDDAFIATGSDDDTVILWQWSASADTWVHYRTLDGHTDDVRSVVFNPAGTVLLSGSADKSIGVWDGKTGEHQTFLREHTAGVNSVAFAFQGNILASGSDDDTVRQLAHTESTDIADRGISLTLSPNLISEVAYGSNSTYFIFASQLPTIEGVDETDVSYGDCTIILDLPGVPTEPVAKSDDDNPRLDNPVYFMYPLNTARQRLDAIEKEQATDNLVDFSAAAAGAGAGFAVGTVVPVAGNVAGAAIGAVSGLVVGFGVNVIANFISADGKKAAVLESTADPVFQITPHDSGEVTGRPDDKFPFLFFVPKSVTTVKLKVIQEYTFKSHARSFWFDPTYTVTYEGTWNLADNTLAAPNAYGMSLVDYRPFQELPVEVQEFFLRHFGEGFNV
ncbi:DUF5050 domain-containing protein, partial [Candidatus Poribacteria bacterium]|nr:DUF5050 domain-containing protein [Candidatus Poribacteria bacterium]